MLNLIFAIKFVHVLAAAAMFGTALAVALFMVLADRSGNVSVIAVTARFAVVVDLMVMIPALALQPISGFPLASAVVLNLPVFLIEILAIGRTLAPAEALACIGAFLLMGTVFGLGFVWNYQDAAL